MKISQLKAEIKNCIYEVLSEGNSATSLDETLLREMATAYKVKDKAGFMDALEKYKAGKGEKFSKTVLAKILNALAEDGEVDYRKLGADMGKSDLASFNNLSTRAKLEDEGGEFTDFLEPLRKEKKLTASDIEKPASEEKPAAKKSMPKDDDDLDIDIEDDYYKDEDEDSFKFDKEPSAKELAKTNAFLKSLEDIDDDDDEF
jgi:hypothetical protein